MVCWACLGIRDHVVKNCRPYLEDTRSIARIVLLHPTANAHDLRAVLDLIERLEDGFPKNSAADDGVQGNATNCTLSVITTAHGRLAKSTDIAKSSTSHSRQRTNYGSKERRAGGERRRGNGAADLGNIFDDVHKSLLFG